MPLEKDPLFYLGMGPQAARADEQW